MGIARGAKLQVSNRGTAALSLRCSRSKISNPFSIFYDGKPIKFSFNVILVALILTIIISRTTQILLKPLRQPRLVSDMIGGILMGPSLMAQSPMFVSMVFPLTAEFLLKNLGLIGLMLFLFLSGVKMDIGLLTRSGKKQICIALVSVFSPLVVVTVVAFCTRKSMDEQLARFSSTGAIASSMAVSTFPIQYVVLQELNLLSSDVGIMTLSTALISDSFGFNFISAFEAMKQSEVSTACALWYLLSTFVFVVFLLGSAHQAMLWIIRKTPEGQPVDQIYVITIFLSVFGFGFLSDMFGLAICNGSFWLGLVIPSGPPLGATLVEKSETIIMEVFMPCTYVFFGLNTDFHAMQEAGWSALSPLFGLIISGYLSKFLSTLLAARLVDLSWRESLAVSLVLSLRGQVELILYYHWVDKDIIGVAGFTMLMYTTAILMGILTPMISILYDPSKPYMVSQRRTIQHTAPNDYLRILVCIKDKEHLQTIVNLLQVSYPTSQNPFSIHVFHHVDFIGRGNPLFIDHQKQEFGELASRFPDWERIHNALTLYQESREDCVDLQFFSASTAKITMYQDVCKLALESNSVIIILPLEKKCDGEIAAAEQWGGGNQSVIIQVMENAPCSVGLLVDKAERRQLPQDAAHSFIVLFLGGPDSREALSYSGRMAGNPSVSLTVVRFLSPNGEGDDEMQKKLDDGVVTSFWVQNERNERVSYREVVARDGADTVAVILEMAKDKYYDMWIVGRKQGINPSLLEGLSTWTENQEELGIIGDYVSSSESVNADSVLVIQKQVLRGNTAAATTTSTNSTATTSRRRSLFR